MNCIIIEDEIPAQEILQIFMDKIPDLELKGTFNSALLANTILKTTPIDVIFLDINLPAISGINFLKTLANPPKIIMTTAYTNYAVESFEYDFIIDYLVKPFSFERFLKAINKLENTQQAIPQTVFNQPITEVSSNAESVFINVDKTLHKVNLNEIVYVQSDRNYVTIITESNKFSFIDTLKNWNEYLTEANFIQIHKSFIINTKYIDKITGNLVYIAGEKIPVGKMYKETLFNFIKPIN